MPRLIAPVRSIFPCLTLALLVLGLVTAAPAQTNPFASSATDEQPHQLTSPRATMASFMALGQQAGDQPATWTDAAQCLQMPAKLEDQATPRAQMLYEVLVKLDPQPPQLLDEQTVEAGGLTTFQFFPQDQHHVWLAQHMPGGQQAYQSLKQHPITLVRNDAGQWRFSPQTITDLPTLAQKFEPVPAKAELGTLDRILNWLGPTFRKTSSWGWLALLITLAVGLAVGRGAKWLLNRLADRCGRQTWGVRATILHDAAAPASLLALTIGLSVGLNFIHTQGTVKNVLNGTIELLYILAFGWFVYNLIDTIDLALRRVTTKANHKINESVIPLVRRTLRGVVIIILLLLIAQNVFDMNITGLLAGLGVAGLAISLAAQESVKNVFGSLTVFFDKAFAVNDYITFGEYTGIVEEIGFRSTRIRLLNGHLVTIPNMKFIDGDIENIGARPYIRRVMDVTITYDTPPEKVQQAVAIVRQILTEDQEVVEQGRFDMTNFPPRIAFDAMNDDNLNIKAYYWYQLEKNPDRGFWTYLQHCELVNQKIFERFEQAGIDFAFPTQTLHLANDDKRQLAVRMLQESGANPAS